MKKDYLRMATRRKKSSDCYALACMTNDEELVFIRAFSAFKKLQTALQKEIQSLTDALAGEGISLDAIQITDDTESTKVSWDGGMHSVPAFGSLKIRFCGIIAVW